MTAPAPHTERPRRLVQQARGVVPTITKKEKNMHDSTGATEPQATPVGFAAGDRVMSTAPDGSAGKVGTVRSVEQHPARYDDAGAEVLPARVVVTVDLDRGTTGVTFTADGDEPLHLVRTAPPITCTSWCEDNDGHPDCIHPGDQVCQSEPAYVRPARPATGGWKGFQTFAVHARRNPGRQPVVVMWEQESDVEQVLTAHEAWALASALLSAACCARDTATDPLPTVNVGRGLVMVEAFTQADGSPAVDVDVSQPFDDPQQLEELAANLTRWAAWLRSALKPTKGAA